MLEQFTQLGFNSTEAKVYLGLAEIGKATAQAIAKRVRIPRTTVYSALENLSQKGVVALESKRGTTFYVANQPSSLLRLVENQKAELSQREKAARELVEQISPFFLGKNFSVPKLQFFDGTPNVESMLYDFSDEWAASTRKYDSVWWGYQDPSFVDQYRPWLEWYWKRMMPEDKIRLLSNEAPVERELRARVKNRTIFPIASELPFSSTIWVCGDYIVLIMSKQEPHYAFQLNDAVFAANLRQLFMLLWATLGVRANE